MIEKLKYAVNPRKVEEDDESDESEDDSAAVGLWNFITYFVWFAVIFLLNWLSDLFLYIMMIIKWELRFVISMYMIFYVNLLFYEAWINIHAVGH